MADAPAGESKRARRSAAKTRNTLIGVALLAGFVGLYQYTQKKKNPCQGVDCGAHGSCKDGKCQCRDGWSGTKCEKPPGQACDGVKCEHGVCQGGKCVCDAGWKGDKCDEKKPTDGCTGQRCGVHGIPRCDTDKNRGYCECIDGYTGDKCDIPPEEEEEQEEQDEEEQEAGGGIWTNLHVSATSIACPTKDLWFRTESSNKVWMSRNRQDWTSLSSGIQQVTAAADGFVVGVTPGGKVAWYSGDDRSWHDLPSEKAVQVTAASAEKMICRTTDGRMQVWDPQGYRWIGLASGDLETRGAAWVSQGQGAQALWYVDVSGRAIYMDQSGWAYQSPQSFDAAQISVFDRNRVFLVTRDGGLQKFTGKFVNVPTPRNVVVRQVAVGRDDVMILDKDNNVWVTSQL